MLPLMLGLLLFANVLVFASLMLFFGRQATGAAGWNWRKAGSRIC